MRVEAGGLSGFFHFFAFLFVLTKGVKRWIIEINMDKEQVEEKIIL